MTKICTLGLDTQHIIESKYFGCPMHVDLEEPLIGLAQAAENSGFELGVVSGFRDFCRQLGIWNAKAEGARPVLGSAGERLDVDSLSPSELVFAILRWSALPGASRHHWGTDVDVIDRAGVCEGYQIQLTVEETCGNGPFSAFHYWLDDYLMQEECNFYRPYAVDTGGVAPEPWHLSYKSLAEKYEEAVNPDVIKAFIKSQPLALKCVVLDHFDEIYERFIAPSVR